MNLAQSYKTPKSRDMYLPSYVSFITVLIVLEYLQNISLYRSPLNARYTRYTCACMCVCVWLNSFDTF